MTEPSSAIYIPKRRRYIGRDVAALIIALAVLTFYFTQVETEYHLYLYNRFLLFAICAVALNLLMGTAGLVSLGTAAFLAVGAYASVALLRAGVPFPADVLLSGAIGSALGLVVGVPSLRIKGIYLALATLAAHFSVTFIATKYQAAEAGPAGFIIPSLFGGSGTLLQQEYWAVLLFLLLCLATVSFSRLSALRTGRAWRMIRDHEAAAPAVGINVSGYKLLAFTISSGVITMCGGILLHFTGSATIESFGLDVAIAAVAMIVIGGLDSVAGAVIGAAVITALPQVIPEALGPLLPVAKRAIAGPQVAEVIYGLLIVLLVTRSPGGIAAWGRELGAIATALVARRRMARLAQSHRKP
jgi:branched-chain amino acid transport system permease protein